MTDDDPREWTVADLLDLADQEDCNIQVHSYRNGLCVAHSDNEKWVWNQVTTSWDAVEKSPAEQVWDQVTRLSESRKLS